MLEIENLLKNKPIPFDLNPTARLYMNNIRFASIFKSIKQTIKASNGPNEKLQPNIFK